MKYIRKIVALIIGVAFIASLVIGIGVIFAIKNVNITLYTYSDDEVTRESDYRTAKAALSSIKGGSIMFVNEKNIVEALESEDSNYFLASYEKIYPCTINVVLQERLETFSVAFGGGFSMFDASGKFLRQSKENVNINDGFANVLIEGVSLNGIEEVAKIATDFKSKFNLLRSTVESISVDENSAIPDYAERIIFKLKSGIKIEIINFRTETDKKLQAAYIEYSALTDRQKLGGIIRSYQVTETQEVRALYSPIG